MYYYRDSCICIPVSLACISPRYTRFYLPMERFICSFLHWKKKKIWEIKNLHQTLASLEALLRPPSPSNPPIQQCSVMFNGPQITAERVSAPPRRAVRSLLFFQTVPKIGEICQRIYIHLQCFPDKIPLTKSPRQNPPDQNRPEKKNQLRCSVATLFPVVARFARVRNEDSSRNRFAVNGIQRIFFRWDFIRIPKPSYLNTVKTYVLLNIKQQAISNGVRTLQVLKIKAKSYLKIGTTIFRNPIFQVRCYGAWDLEKVYRGTTSVGFFCTVFISFCILDTTFCVIL